MGKLFKQQAAYLAADNKNYGPVLKPFDFPKTGAPPGLQKVWRSSRFMAQLYHENGGVRLSINRTAIDVVTGRWIDGITWDELQALKAQAGFGDRMAVEIYPADGHVVNVANMRHLWILDDPLPFAWKKGD